MLSVKGGGYFFGGEIKAKPEPRMSLQVASFQKSDFTWKKAIVVLA